MNFFKRALILFLSFILVISTLISCGKDDVKKEETVASTTKAVTDAEDEPSKETFPVVLSDANGIYYTVVRPEGSNAVMKEMVDALVRFSSDTAGVQKLDLHWSTDQQEVQGTEILIGYTNRPESREVLESLEYDDFAIVFKNGKIVVAAHTEHRLQEAVVYLCGNLLKIEEKENGNPKLLYLGDYIFHGEKKELLFDSQNLLSDYSIVYPSSSSILKTEAEAMRDRIKEVFGAELSVRADSTAEREQEILLGNTNRALSQKYFANGAEVYSFSSMTVVEGHKLLIGGATDEVTSNALKAFAKQYFQAGYSYTFNMGAKTDLLDTGFTFSETPALAQGAEMRFMSFNILSEYLAPKVSVDERKNIVAATILTYAPDVIGLQEATSRWKKTLTAMLKGKYAFLDTRTERGKDNSSPLMYNMETVTLLEHGVRTLASGNSESARVISWGYFERKSDGARFLVANTHWDLTGMTESRTKQAIEMGDFIASMKQKYNCPAITVGDYNTQSHQDQFRTYLEHSGLFDAGLTAKVINRNFKSTHTLFEPPVPAPDILAIDHVFYSSDIEALYYNMLIDEDVLDASDHFPVYADIRFK